MCVSLLLFTQCFHSILLTHHRFSITFMMCTQTFLLVLSISLIKTIYKFINCNLVLRKKNTPDALSIGFVNIIFIRNRKHGNKKNNDSTNSEESGYKQQRVNKKTKTARKRLQHFRINTKNKQTSKVVIFV